MEQAVRERKIRVMIYVENNHPAIIPRGIYYQVWEEMARRTSKRKVMQKSANFVMLYEQIIRLKR